jgi:NDP-sugar pyrophosphorylase family protein
VLDFSRIGRLIFAVDHHADLIIEWIKAQKFTCEVVVSYQKKEGILGAVESALSFVSTKHFIVCNTDEIRQNFSMSNFLSNYDQSTYKSAMATTLSSSLYNHRVIFEKPKGKIATTELKNELYKELPNRKGIVNTGFVLYSKDVVDKFDNSLGHGWSTMINPLVEAGDMQSIQDELVCYFNVGTLTELIDASDCLFGSSAGVLRLAQEERITAQIQ